MLRCSCFLEFSVSVCLCVPLGWDKNAVWCWWVSQCHWIKDELWDVSWKLFLGKFVKIGQIDLVSCLGSKKLLSCSVSIRRVNNQSINCILVYVVGLVEWCLKVSRRCWGLWPRCSASDYLSVVSNMFYSYQSPFYTSQECQKFLSKTFCLE